MSHEENSNDSFSPDDVVLNAKVKTDFREFQEAC